MAAPTSVSAESNSITTARIYYTYAGANPIGVYRSTDGSAYSLVTNNVSSSPYTDTGLATGTKYWYKLSDDVGSTFSSVVTVVTHSCPEEAHEQAFNLPRFDNPEQQAADLNAMAERIEAVLSDAVLAPDQCPTCPVDGAIVIDCSDCYEWIVVADTDINSISIKNCNAGKISFIIPPNTTVAIGGWPFGFGFTGQEGAQVPISGGTDGRTMTVAIGGGKAAGAESGRGYPKDPNAREAGRGGSSCACTSGVENQLTIKSCNANNSLDCANTKKLKLVACGGRQPYTWSKTGDISLSASSGSTISVTPPTNSGTGVAGVAYTRLMKSCAFEGGGAGACSGGGGGATNNISWRDYGCNDVATGACSDAQDTGADESGCGNAAELASPEGTGGTCPTFCASGSRVNAMYAGGQSPCDSDATLAGGSTCDRRTAQMILDGCSPCGIQAGSTVSVTDALGVVATIIVRT